MPINIWPSYFNICVATFIFLLTLGIAFYAWLHRHLPAARAMMMLGLGGALWAVAYLLELTTHPVHLKQSFENIEYLAISIILIYYLVFAINYTRKQEKLAVWFWVLIVLEPIANQIVLWLDPFLHWFRKASFVQTSGLDYPGILNSTYGPWFWVNLIYTVLFFVVTLALLIISYFSAPKWSRNRTWYLILAVFLPLLVTILTIPSWVMNYHDYLLNLSLAVSMFIMAWGVFHTRLLDIVPIARETLLDQVSDAILVLDSTGKVVDLNNAAQEQFNTSPLAWIGKPFTEILPEFADITLEKANTQPRVKQIVLDSDARSYSYELKVSSLYSDTKTHAGWLIIFHDVTVHTLEEEKLRAAENEAQRAVQEAQHHQNDLNIIRSLTETLNQSKSMRQALLPALEVISTIFQEAAIWVFLQPDESDPVQRISFSAKSATSPLHFRQEETQIPGCLKTLQTGHLLQPVVLECDCLSEQEKGPSVLQKHLAFPLQVGERHLGVLNIALANGQMIDEGAVYLTESLCNSLSVAIERVIQSKAEHEQKRLAIAQQQISSTLTAALNLEEVLDLLIEQVNRLVPYTCGNVMLVEDQTARIARSRGYEFLGPAYVASMMTWVFPVENTKNVASILESKRPLIIEDIALDPDWVQMEQPRLMHSWLGAPIIIDDRVVAIFSLEHKERGFYTSKDAERMQSFCASAALAIQNATLFEETRKRVREFESLQSTMQDITSELDLKQLLHEITERSIVLLESTSGVLGLVNNETRCIDIVVGISPAEEFAGEVIPIGKGAMGNVAQALKPLVIDDYGTWPNKISRFEKAFPHAMLQVPLLAGTELLGVIGVGDANPKRKYSQEDIRLLSLFAQQATIGIRNARLFAKARLQAEEANTLREASKIVASTLEQKEALRLILNQLAKVVPFDTASVLLEKEGELEVVEGKGFTDASPLVGIHIELNSNQPGAAVFTSKKPLIVHNMPKEYPKFSEINQLQIKSWIGVPLIYGNRTIGILALDSFEPDRYDEDHARLASAFAGHVSIALENVRLYQTALQSAKRLAALYKLSQHISSNLQPEEVYHAIHKSTKDLMASDSFILSLYDEKTQMINDVYFVDHGIPQKLTSRALGVGLATKVIKEKKTIFYNNFNLNMVKRTNAVLVGEDKDDSVVRSLIIVPLKLGKSVRGILSTQSYSANAYSQEDKETLELLAAHAVVALENAHLFSEVQELAITDSLTKIYNRRRFFELAELEFDRSRRYGSPVSVIMMDIDHFKRVNDSFGHAVGDAVLEKLAGLCAKSLREVDVFARYGGEEFVILLPETTSEEAHLTAERIRQLVARTPIDLEEHSLNVTMSFGIADLDETCRNIEELLDRSDQALYHSKRTGRNRVSVWSPTSTSVRPTI